MGAIFRIFGNESQPDLLLQKAGYAHGVYKHGWDGTKESCSLGSKLLLPQRYCNRNAFNPEMADTRDFKNPGRGESETRPEVTFPISDEERMRVAFSSALENAAWRDLVSSSQLREIITTFMPLFSCMIQFSCQASYHSTWSWFCFWLIQRASMWNIRIKLYRLFHQRWSILAS